MYAINHAATALLLKKKEDSMPMLPLLISTQVIEILWVVFNWLGIEHFSIEAGKLHLDYLPYSHSVFSTVLLSLLSYVVIRWGFKKKKLALLFAIGVLSHLVLDLIFHEKDIRLSPFSDKPAWGLGIIRTPILNFILESLYGVFCWWYYKGNKALLITIIVFNLLDLPVMLASGDALTIFKEHSFLLPTFILFQILITWFFVWRYSKVPDKSGTLRVN
jgi:hypothetical protein